MITNHEVPNYVLLNFPFGYSPTQNFVKKILFVIAISCQEIGPFVDPLVSSTAILNVLLQSLLI